MAEVLLLTAVPFVLSVIVGCASLSTSGRRIGIALLVLTAVLAPVWLFLSYAALRGDFYGWAGPLILTFAWHGQWIGFVVAVVAWAVTSNARRKNDSAGH